MPGRISTRTLHESIAQSIGAANQKVLKLQQGLGDGRAVRRPSDDPVRTHQSMLFREQIRAGDQYERTLSGTISVLSATESAMQDMQDILADLRALQASASDDSVGAEGRQVIAAQIGDAMELLVSLGNTQYAGRYLFGGRQTLSPPLVVRRTSEGTTESVGLSPGGVAGSLKRQVSADVSLTINVTAVDLFGQGAELFSTLGEFRGALLRNDGDAIRSAAEKLDRAGERVSDATTVIGSLMSRAESLHLQVQQERVSYEDGRSRAEDLDMARAIVDFQSQQVALQAALSSGSRILNLSLLDFLK